MKKLLLTPCHFTLSLFLHLSEALNSFSNSNAGMESKETCVDLPRVVDDATSVFKMPIEERY